MRLGLIESVESSRPYRARVPRHERTHSRAPEQSRAPLDADAHTPIVLSVPTASVVTIPGRDDTGAGSSQLQWIVSGYTLAFGLVPVLGGKLGDDHGRRLMFQVGVGAVGFAVATSLPRKVLMSWPERSGSPQHPPSPMLEYSLP